LELNKHKIPAGKDPVFWKANGDELIYTKELAGKRDLLACIHAWTEGVKHYQANLRQTDRLDLKATAWTAGFPITNVEIAFDEKFEPPNENPYPDDGRLRQFHLLERAYSQTDQSAIVRDFLGPTIDTGFRLTSKATSRKMIISVDVAYLLAGAHMPDPTRNNSALKFPCIKYDGRCELKGVLGGRPYPLFWIDLRDGAATKEDALLPEQKTLGREPILEFCNEFYEEHKTLMMTPFIVNEDISQYPQIPENYQECLEHLNSRWQAEKERYEEERRGIAGDKPEENTHRGSVSTKQKKAFVDRVLATTPPLKKAKSETAIKSKRRKKTKTKLV